MTAYSNDKRGNVGSAASWWKLFFLGLGAALLASGCTTGPVFDKTPTAIDRKFIEFPPNTELVVVAHKFTAPTAFDVDEENTLIVVEKGQSSGQPRIVGWKKDGTPFTIYPIERGLSFMPGSSSDFRIYGPVTGLVAYKHFVYVAHRDENGFGIITRFDYAGNHTTLIAAIPSQGDYGLTELVIRPSDGRIYFGVGSATNSGVVGLDNQWIKKYPKFCNLSATKLILRGAHFESPNPFANWFEGDRNINTGPWQPFGESILDTIQPVQNNRPTGCIESIDIHGGDLRIEATGVRNPRGLAINDTGRPYFTDEGMELRGTRPIKDDPDVVFRLVPGGWYGFPDYSRNLIPITDQRFQPPTVMIVKTGYERVSPLIDEAASKLQLPDRDAVLEAELRPLSGAANLAFCPSSGVFKNWRGQAIIALFGDRAPFATNGMPLAGFTGYKVVRSDLNGMVEDVIHNTSGMPASHQQYSNIGLERPIDVKFGPDGALYILDFGRMEMHGDEERITPGTGVLYRLSGVSNAAPTTP